MKLMKVYMVMLMAAAIAITAVAQTRQGTRNGDRNSNPAYPRLNTTVLKTLSSEEAAKLLFIREEEKLAMDVYQALYEKWRLSIFSNIAASEKRHFEAVGTLIARYDLADPAKEAAGEFTNSDLQTLYTDLVGRGMLSLIDALEVGIEIEEMDMQDLQDAISTTDNRDVLMVYGNLFDGSSNHLAAFSSHLEVAIQ
jgi:hypothetical protein